MENIERPVLRHHSECYAVKDEDILFWHQAFPKDAPYGDPEWSVFCLCDGHNGDASAKFLEKRLVGVLLDKLPSESVTQYTTSEGQRFSIAIARAIVETFETLDEEWQLKQKLSGSTITIAVLHGWLLTVANVGDSLAYLHCDGCMYHMTQDHRLSSNVSEQDRLKDSGVEVAGLNEFGEQAAAHEAAFGPLRAWPGGLAMGRSFGDLDVDPAVFCRPYIKQIQIPPHAGARLLMASDGLWDHLSSKVALKGIKKTNVSSACTKLMNMVRRVGGFDDDTTVLVLDIVSQQNAHLQAPVHPKKTKKMKVANVVRSLSGKSKQGKSPMPFHLTVDSLDLDQVLPINDSAHGENYAKEIMAEYMHDKLSKDSTYSLSSDPSEGCQ